MPLTTIEEALAAYLADSADLTALVGTRIFPDKIPQEVILWPALCYEHQTGNETPYLSGEANDLHRDTFDITAVSPVRKQVAQVRDVLMAMFGGVVCRGFWQPGIFVSGCIPSLTTATDHPPRDGSERHDREASVNVIVLWGRR